MVTTYFKNLVANHIWHTSAEAELPTSYYLALSSTEPLEDGTGVTEPDASSGYTRIILSDLSEAVDGAVRNTAIMAWPELDTDQGTTTHWALFDAATGGHLLMGNQFSDAKHLDAGTAITVKAQRMTLNVLGA